MNSIFYPNYLGKTITMTTGTSLTCKTGNMLFHFVYNTCKLMQAFINNLQMQSVLNACQNLLRYHIQLRNHSSF